nr:retrovirus-related Pol polyprotein from transposon TNT 1-94 [Tanacetum cinerariifolium]
FSLKGYLDSDYAGCNIDRKSTSSAYQLLGGKLVCWSAKKQQFIAMSSTEAEYVPIFCDNTSSIVILNNPVLHSRTKHIDIRYHFIRDHILKGEIELHFIPTQYQLTDIFTKPLDEPAFKRLIVKLCGKTDGLDQISNKDAIILYCLANEVHVDYAKLIWEDLIHKLNKKTREKIVPYVRFISLLLKHMMPKYDNEELTINPTQDKSLSHPSPPTPVAGEMHKEAHQVAGGLTSLGATSEEGAHPQLISDESEEDEADKGDTHDVPEDTSVAELKNIQWELLAEFQAIPSLVSLVQKKLQTLDSLPSLLNKVTETLDRFTIMVENASRTTTKDVPSAGEATAPPAEGEKNTKDADINLKDELVDLLGKNVVTQYYTKKLLFDKYCDKMLKRKRNPKITNYEVLTKKGPITLKIYREDGYDKVISNIKRYRKDSWKELQFRLVDNSKLNVVYLFNIS